MEKIKTNTLKPGLSFTGDLYIDNLFLLVPHTAHISEDLIKALKLWQFETLKKMGIKLDENNFENIAEVIKNASDSKELSEQRKIAKETAWMNIGNAGKNIVDFMIQKEESLSKKEGK